VRVEGLVVTPDGVVDGHVEVAGDRIAAVVGDVISPDGHGISAGSRPWVVPGFVDIHNHGGGGHTFTTGDPDAARAAAEFHLRHGTTSVIASLVSSPHELMRDAVTALSPLIPAGVLAGIHFEGPYLSVTRCGAQNEAYLRDACPDELKELIALGNGTVRMVTLAPERPGALDAIALLRSAGVVAAIGHTDATYEETLAAIDAGATVGTHLFNGMRPPHHREPGPVVALLDAPGVVCELVADGAHMHDGMLAFAASVAGPERIALVTDAMAAAGTTDGSYDLGGQAVVVTDGVARLASNGSIAGSTLTMDAALRRAVAVGVPMVAACRMAATTPALAIGLFDRGGILPGQRADVLTLGQNLGVCRVLRAGEWV
jgi:N-acetylglucosamine-6-phosphate deacetylase